MEIRTLFVDDEIDLGNFIGEFSIGIDDGKYSHWVNLDVVEFIALKEHLDNVFEKAKKVEFDPRWVSKEVQELLKDRNEDDES